MNDLLANLLARSFGWEPVDAVQPRLPARFEQVAMSLPIEHGREAVADPVLSPPVVPTSVASPSSTGSDVLPAALPLPLVPSASASPSPRAGSTTPPPPAVSLPQPVDSTTLFPDRSAASVPAQPAASEVAATPDRKRSLLSVTATPVTTGSPAERVVPAADLVSPPTRPAPVGERSVGVESFTAVSASVQGTLSVTEATPVTFPVATETGKPTPVAVEHRDAEPPSRSPRITITIGRVEIRAIPAPAPATQPRSRPPAPALSLDDYLKRRNGDRS